MNRKNPQYLKFVRTLDCCNCGCPDTVAHHIIGAGFSGMGLKAPCVFAMPLCTFCHAEVHDNGTAHQQYRWVIETQYKAKEAGISLS